jgi:hypothetical protein
VYCYTSRSPSLIRDPYTRKQSVLWYMSVGSFCFFCRNFLFCFCRKFLFCFLYEVFCFFVGSFCFVFCFCRKFCLFFVGLFCRKFLFCFLGSFLVQRTLFEIWPRFKKSYVRCRKSLFDSIDSLFIEIYCENFTFIDYLKCSNRLPSINYTHQQMHFLWYREFQNTH